MRWKQARLPYALSMKGPKPNSWRPPVIELDDKSGHFVPRKPSKIVKTDTRKHYLGDGLLGWYKLFQTPSYWLYKEGSKNSDSQTHPGSLFGLSWWCLLTIWEAFLGFLDGLQAWAARPGIALCPYISLFGLSWWAIGSVAARHTTMLWNTGFIQYFYDLAGQSV